MLSEGTKNVFPLRADRLQGVYLVIGTAGYPDCTSDHCTPSQSRPHVLELQTFHPNFAPSKSRTKPNRDPALQWQASTLLFLDDWADISPLRKRRKRQNRSKQIQSLYMEGQSLKSRLDSPTCGSGGCTKNFLYNLIIPPCPSSFGTPSEADDEVSVPEEEDSDNEWDFVNGVPIPLPSTEDEASLAGTEREDDDRSLYSEVEPSERSYGQSSSGNLTERSWSGDEEVGEQQIGLISEPGSSLQSSMVSSVGTIRPAANSEESEQHPLTLSPLSIPPTSKTVVEGDLPCDNLSVHNEASLTKLYGNNDDLIGKASDLSIAVVSPCLVDVLDDGASRTNEDPLPSTSSFRPRPSSSTTLLSTQEDLPPSPPGSAIIWRSPRRSASTPAIRTTAPVNQDKTTVEAGAVDYLLIREFLEGRESGMEIGLRGQISMEGLERSFDLGRFELGDPRSEPEVEDNDRLAASTITLKSQEEALTARENSKVLELPHPLTSNSHRTSSSSPQDIDSSASTSEPISSLPLSEETLNSPLSITTNTTLSEIEAELTIVRQLMAEQECINLELDRRCRELQIELNESHKEILWHQVRDKDARVDPQVYVDLEAIINGLEKISSTIDDTVFTCVDAALNECEELLEIRIDDERLARIIDLCSDGRLSKFHGKLVALAEELAGAERFVWDFVHYGASILVDGGVFEKVLGKFKVGLEDDEDRIHKATSDRIRQTGTSEEISKWRTLTYAALLPDLSDEVVQGDICVRISHAILDSLQQLISDSVEAFLPSKLQHVRDWMLAVDVEWANKFMDIVSKAMKWHDLVQGVQGRKEIKVVDEEDVLPAAAEGKKLIVVYGFGLTLGQMRLVDGKMEEEFRTPVKVSGIREGGFL